MREHIFRAWIENHLDAGFRHADIPEAFWLLERMPNGVAPPQHLQEVSNDTTAALLNPRMLPFTFAGTSDDRKSEPLHRAILMELAPALTRIPFDTLAPLWPEFPRAPKRARRHHDTWHKVRREWRRRAAARRMQRVGALDQRLLDARQTVATAVDMLPDHVIWEVLDRRRTRRLVDRDPYKLDPRSQVTLWRVATVLSPDTRTIRA